MPEWYSSDPEPEQNDQFPMESDTPEEAPQPDIAAQLSEQVQGLQRELQEVRGSIRDPAEYQAEHQKRLDEQALSEQIQLAVKTARERIDEAAITGDVAAMANAYKVLDWAHTYHVAQLSERLQPWEQRLEAIVAAQESTTYAEAQRHRFMVEEPDTFEAAEAFVPHAMREIMSRGATYDQAREVVTGSLRQLHGKLGFDGAIRQMADAVRRNQQSAQAQQGQQQGVPQQQIPPRQQRVVPFPTSVRGNSPSAQTQDRPAVKDPLVLAMTGG